jgi:general secretion pathway protein L
MARTLIVWLPPAAALAEGAETPPVRLSALDGEGDGDLVDAEPGGDDRLIAIAPAADVPLRFLPYPGAAPAQAAAAARLDALKDSLGDPAALHIVAGLPAEAGEAVPLAVTTHAAMTAWTGWLAGHGLTPAAIVPAAALPPPPAPGTLGTADLGGERIVRGADRAWLSDPAIDALIAGEGAVAPIDSARLRRSLLSTLAAPPLDLLGGAWKPKRSWGVDAALSRTARRLLAALMLVTLAIPVVHALRLAADADRAEAAAVAMARKAGVTAPDAAAAEAGLDRRLSAAGGGPLAFSVPASALYRAMTDAPGVSLRSLSHRADGTLTAMLAAPRVEDVNQVLLALQARGYRVTAQPMSGSDGQQMANVTIRAVP